MSYDLCTQGGQLAKGESVGSVLPAKELDLTPLASPEDGIEP
jgi:hypothetical protein